MYDPQRPFGSKMSALAMCLLASLSVSFSAFAAQVGIAAMAGLSLKNDNGRALGSVQIGAVRSTPWSRYSEDAQRMAAL